MLLDQVFGKPGKIEQYIVVKNGEVENKIKQVPYSQEHDQPQKTLFPINDKINQKW